MSCIRRMRRTDTIPLFRHEAHCADSGFEFGIIQHCGRPDHGRK